MMDIEKLIKLIKRRPGMFVGERLNVRSVYLFVSGFLYSSLVNNSEYVMDTVFRENIHGWIKSVIEQRNGITFEEKDCVFYVESVCENGEQEMALFFELCEQFFEEKRNRNI